MHPIRHLLSCFRCPPTSAVRWNHLEAVRQPDAGVPPPGVLSLLVWVRRWHWNLRAPLEIRVGTPAYSRASPCPHGDEPHPGLRGHTQGPVLEVGPQQVSSFSKTASLRPKRRGGQGRAGGEHDTEAHQLRSHRIKPRAQSCLQPAAISLSWTFLSRRRETSGLSHKQSG